MNEGSDVKKFSLGQPSERTQVSGPKNERRTMWYLMAEMWEVEMMDCMRT